MGGWGALLKEWMTSILSLAFAQQGVPKWAFLCSTLASCSWQAEIFSFFNLFSALSIEITLTFAYVSWNGFFPLLILHSLLYLLDTCWKSLCVCVFPIWSYINDQMKVFFFSFPCPWHSSSARNKHSNIQGTKQGSVFRIGHFWPVQAFSYIIPQ